MLWHACGYAQANKGHDTQSGDGHRSIQHGGVHGADTEPIHWRD
jgi:hypothetical protein